MPAAAMAYDMRRALITKIVALPRKVLQDSDASSLRGNTSLACQEDLLPQDECTAMHAQHTCKQTSAELQM